MVFLLHDFLPAPPVMIYLFPFLRCVVALSSFELFFQQHCTFLPPTKPNLPNKFSLLIKVRREFGEMISQRLLDYVDFPSEY